jgi:predicted MPP superfamily phosphohydrolase
LSWNPPPETPSGALILLSHIPEDYHGAAQAGVDLMLSGHTHGGQVWPFSLLVALKHVMVSGRYEAEGMTLLVSRGTGTWGPRMRLWHPGEILNITLRAQTETHTAMNAEPKI